MVDKELQTSTESFATKLLKHLHHLGVEYVFYVPGAQISPLLQTLYDDKIQNIPKPIAATHELAAGFMAMGYAANKNKTGVVLAIGGPGAAYMLPAASAAKHEGLPVIFISGDIPTAHSNQNEFQDSGINGTNDCAIYSAAIGHSMRIENTEDFTSFSKTIDAQNNSPLHFQIPLDVLKSNCKSSELTIKGKQKTIIEEKPSLSYSDVKHQVSTKNHVSYKTIFSALAKHQTNKTVYSCDAGQVRKMVNSSLNGITLQNIIQCSSLAPMGFGICGSIGIQLANGTNKTIALFGDGSMQMHGFELSTAVKYNLPILFILCDNGEYSSTKNIPEQARKLHSINWSDFSKGINLKCLKVENDKEFCEALNTEIKSKIPVLIWAKVPSLLEKDFVNEKNNNWLK